MLFLTLTLVTYLFTCAYGGIPPGRFEKASPMKYDHVPDRGTPGSTVLRELACDFRENSFSPSCHAAEDSRYRERLLETPFNASNPIVRTLTASGGFRRQGFAYAQYQGYAVTVSLFCNSLDLPFFILNWASQICVPREPNLVKCMPQQFRRFCFTAIRPANHADVLH